MATNRKRKGERPDGLIQVALDIGYQEDGRRKRKYFYGHTRTEAEAKREAYKNQLSSASLYSGRMDVHDWIEEYKKTYLQGINPAYLKHYYVPLNRLENDLGYKRITDVTEVDLQRSLNKLAGMSYSTVDKYRNTLKRVFDRARKNRIINDNPAIDLELPSYKKQGTHRALESWEINLILSRWNDKGLSAGLWVMIMLLAGLRRGEMIALNWENVNLDARLIEVRQTAVLDGNTPIIENRAKTDAGIRAIPICKPLFDALSSVPEKDRKGLVCRLKKNQPLTTRQVQYGLTVFCKALNISFRAHDLRHTFCTMLYTSGVDVKTAAYFMGHSDISVTMRIYTHLSNAKKAESQSLMLDYFNALPPPKEP